jgi:hypothetical protein
MSVEKKESKPEEVEIAPGVKITPPLRLLQFKASNVKNIEACALDLRKARGVRLEGRNGAGKSSVIDSFMWAMYGKRAMPEEHIIRRGASEASAWANFGAIKIMRKKTKKSDRVIVSADDGTPEGRQISRPQEVIDRLREFFLDPDKFCELAGKELAEHARRILGLDFSELDKERARIYEERKRIGAIADERKAQASGIKAEADRMPQFADAPAKEVSVEDLLKEMEKRKAANAERERIIAAIEHERSQAERFFEAERHGLDMIDADVRRLAEKRQALVKAIADVDQQQVEQLERREQSLTLIKQRQENIADCEARKVAEAQARPVRDIEEIRVKGAALQETNKKVRANANRAEKQQEAEGVRRQAVALSDQYDEMTGAIKRIDETKAQRISEAPFPIEGLAFDGDTLMYQGYPFDRKNLSYGVTMKVATAFLLAQHKAENRPTQPIVSIKGADLIDDEQWPEIEELIEKANGLLIHEHVVSGSDLKIIIEGVDPEPEPEEESE